MASEIIPAGDSDANVTIFRGNIPTCHCIYPIHIMCDNNGLILENIALEILTLGVYTANVTISNVTFDPNVYVHVPLTLYKFIFYLILANMALEIIRGGESNADATISREKLIPTCHCIHPIHI